VRVRIHGPTDIEVYGVIYNNEPRREYCLPRILTDIFDAALILRLDLFLIVVVFQSTARVRVHVTYLRKGVPKALRRNQDDARIVTRTSQTFSKTMSYGDAVGEARGKRQRRLQQEPCRNEPHVHGM